MEASLDLPDAFEKPLPLPSPMLITCALRCKRGNCLCSDMNPAMLSACHRLNAFLAVRRKAKLLQSTTFEYRAAPEAVHCIRFPCSPFEWLLTYLISAASPTAASKVHAPIICGAVATAHALTLASSSPIADFRIRFCVFCGEGPN